MLYEDDGATEPCRLGTGDDLALSLAKVLNTMIRRMLLIIVEIAFVEIAILRPNFRPGPRGPELLIQVP
jgi:hypothetical protein